MNRERIHREMNWTTEDRARHRAVRERFRAERPTLAHLVASGECAGPIPHGVYRALKATPRLPRT